MKKIVALLLAMVMVLGLVACSEKKPVETETPIVTEAPATEAPVEESEVVEGTEEVVEAPAETEVAEEVVETESVSE